MDGAGRRVHERGRGAGHRSSGAGGGGGAGGAGGRVTEAAAREAGLAEQRQALLARITDGMRRAERAAAEIERHLAAAAEAGRWRRFGELLLASGSTRTPPERRETLRQEHAYLDQMRVLAAQAATQEELRMLRHELGEAGVLRRRRTDRRAGPGGARAPAAPPRGGGPPPRRSWYSPSRSPRRRRFWKISDRRSAARSSWTRRCRCG